MLTDEQMIGLMVDEPSWEDVIVKIVAEEGMNPWDIDICKLADCFVAYLEKMETLDLRIPGRFVLIAAILLRMKSDSFITEKAHRTMGEGAEKINPLLEIYSSIQPLEPPVKRVPVGNVSVEELIHALKKAFEVKERREVKVYKRRRVVEEALARPFDDIEARIEVLLFEIQDVLKEVEGETSFSKLLKRWERKEIVKKLMPLLHLAQEGKVSVNQEELFKEIMVKLRKKEQEEKEEKNVDENGEEERAESSG